MVLVQELRGSLPCRDQGCSCTIFGKLIAGRNTKERACEGSPSDAQTHEIADYESAAGLVSVWLLRRPFVPYVEVMTVSVWESEQALHQFIKSQAPCRLRVPRRKYSAICPDATSGFAGLESGNR